MPTQNHPLPDWKAVPTPQKQPLSGQTVNLHPLNNQQYADDLYQAAIEQGADLHQWDYLPVGPFNERGTFDRWLISCQNSVDPLYFVITDAVTGTALGLISYLAITPEHGSIEIGHVWFSHRMQKSCKSTETIYLLARHAFDDLGYRRLEWKCDSRNLRSQKAALRLGFTAEGLFRQHRVAKGYNRDTAWFAMLDTEWPKQKQMFERWLASDNFDHQGRQIVSLENIHNHYAITNDNERQ